VRPVFACYRNLVDGYDAVNEIIQANQLTEKGWAGHRFEFDTWIPGSSASTAAARSPPA
jgi:hypothetical protein